MLMVITCDSHYTLTLLMHPTTQNSKNLVYFHLSLDTLTSQRHFDIFRLPELNFVIFLKWHVIVTIYWN